MSVWSWLIWIVMIWLALCVAFTVAWVALCSISRRRRCDIDFTRQRVGR